MADGTFRLAVKKIAVVVEGSSDEVFWDKVLHREFAHCCLFKVMSRKGRTRVIRDAARLLEAFRGAGYCAVFFIVDMDDDPCPTSVRNRFGNDVLDAACATRNERIVHICVARREFESWLLADADAIRAALPKAGFYGEAQTDEINGEKVLEDLIQSDRGPGSAFRKPAFAREVAPHFDPARAVRCSSSLAYFWERMRAAVERPEQ